MNLSFTPEQDELRSMVRRLLAARSAESDVRRAMDSCDGFDPELWAQLAELGLTGLAIPEEFGGAGYGAVEVGIVMEEAGRVLTGRALLLQRRAGIDRDSGKRR